MAKQKTGLSQHEPYLAFGGKIKPTELDRYEQYVILKPNVDDDQIVAACSGTASAGTVEQDYLDYARSLKCTFTEDSGTDWNGTATVKGKDQFGNDITEEFVNSGSGTVSVSGTKVFSYVGTVDLAGTDAATADDMKLGYDDTSGSARFGLPTKISGSADVKRVTWVDGGVTKKGTATVNTDTHSIAPGATVNAADDFIVLFKGNYTSDDDEMALMSNSDSIS